MSERLEDIAAAIVADGKGLLAADESSGTIKKRFDVIGVESTADSRRDYREMMFRAKEAMTKYISGVILYDETIRQKAADGTPLIDIIKASGAIPGIKVDLGAKPLAGFPGDTITEGLDGLRERLAEYYKLGARFAKWRAVIDIDVAKEVPSATSIGSNAHALARYAALCQEAGIVPIVEPEVLMDGAHSIDTCYEVSKATLLKLYGELYAARVVLEGTILKPNMVISGKKSGKKDNPEEVAEKTIKLFRETVPVAVQGIAFLSGGQDDEEATANLNAINVIGPHPWKLSFSYGRALQAAAQKAWSGKASNVAAGQAAFIHRAHMNHLAALGKWRPALEKAA
ncbi:MULTISPECIES: class I fructose-bisphosphate aldolase [unclassified Mesorhizobium]|uniref:class I fructose-bisphosphate aldolase n=1 Tax=unclassified Mesorhizobium TaxID=325217 RepID=UPI000F759ADB|nr:MULTISPECIES: class I fructose-bisphosphate aldolase [unclassified Mesorhizobium]AZO27515.1 fructose-bisphosphate aldolase class I [Mesorhizobium sp. M1B.F.Ca.ET.045.04.1.1]RWD98907.1 MAG: fructose-bisphosphate aldolase class I [Mesorhizobium sp.]